LAKVSKKNVAYFESPKTRKLVEGVRKELTKGMCAPHPCVAWGST